MRDKDGNVLMHKYELIVSHTARRSALTNLYKTGKFNNREMMAISGHQSEKVFEKYIKVGASEQADRIYQMGGAAMLITSWREPAGTTSSR